VNVRFTKSLPEFYLIAKDADSKVTFKLLDAQLLVKHVKPNPANNVAHNKTLHAGALAKYQLSRVEVKTLTLASDSQPLSIDNAVFGTLPRRMLFTLVKNKGYLVSLDMNPYNFRHYDIRHFALYDNGHQNPSEGLHIDIGREKTTDMGFRTLFEASGIRQSNTGLQKKHDMYIAGYFMLHFDLTPDEVAAEGHTSHSDSGHIRIDAQFKKALPDAVTCLLYREYDNCVRIDEKRTVTTDFS
jgi:hypothetical protein